MLDKNSILGLLQNYLEDTHDGNVKVYQYNINPAIVDGVKKGSSNIFSKIEASRRVERKKFIDKVYDFLDELYKRMHARIQSIQRASLKLNLDNVYSVDGTDWWEFSISFMEESFKRHSLIYTRKDGSGRYTGRGIDNIVTLFIQGWGNKRPVKTVYGSWIHPDGSFARNTHNRTHKDPDDFIQELINDYQRLYPELIITIKDPRYKSKNI